VTGKSSNDLAERKCTWVTCQLLQKLRTSRQADTQVEQLFDQHFGRPEAHHLEVAKRIILENGVDTDFLAYQKVAELELREEIAHFPMEGIRKVLGGCVEEIIGRRK
jgi:geranylgeranyl pyrophosphate synthase